ncbi:M23 family metallopeptidase [Celeribacter litoreus]|uniref:M23 family metallopeptidase n=1 Tax=Celeribacter litoreus TaxID=2876714 RepID=UPI001CCE9F7C|nr:M23 family metallopeptidase [Celeribacter litoreus]MCA0042752.1 M23 family metallopeptidase [Celeribacter litoreus]
MAPPLDCEDGTSCYIQNYVDTDPGPGAADFTCGPLSYDGHKGTDFALPTRLEVWRGVDIHAAAPGTVWATRDGMDDFPQDTEGAPDVSGKECGNGVVIDHGDGWRTQYCHMKKDSVRVEQGERVSTATVLGQIGLSGLTEFPHVHFEVRKDGAVVDPFNPEGLISCDEPKVLGGTLWDRGMIYRAGGLLDVGIATDIPAYDSVKAGTAHMSDVTPDNPPRVVFGLAFGGKAGDVMRLTLFGPAGEVFSDDHELEKPQAQFFRAVGTYAAIDWPAGRYWATVEMMRDGMEIDRGEISVELK